MDSAWFRSTFLWVLKFLQIKKGEPNFWEEKLFELFALCPPYPLARRPPFPGLVYLNFKSFKNLSFLSLIPLQCILVDLGVLFSGFRNFCKLKRGDLISGGGGGGGPILQRLRITLSSPLLYLNFKNSKDAYSLTFIRF